VLQRLSPFQRRGNLSFVHSVQLFKCHAKYRLTALAFTALHAAIQTPNTHAGLADYSQGKFEALNLFIDIFELTD